MWFKVEQFALYYLYMLQEKIYLLHYMYITQKKKKKSFKESLHKYMLVKSQFW